MRPRTEPDNAQNQHREDSDNHDEIARTQKCLVHVDVAGSAVSYAFDFSYATEFLVPHLGTFSSLYVSPRLP